MPISSREYNSEIYERSPMVASGHCERSVMSGEEHDAEFKGPYLHRADRHDLLQPVI